jgi:lipoate---protein ligase
MCGSDRVESAFAVHRAAGSAADLHARAFEPPVERAVFALDVEGPALVLGSAQPDAVVEHVVAARLGVEVARRRSGGGAVLLQPGAQVWVDVEVPRDDPLWDDDVGRACWWVGDVSSAARAVTSCASRASVPAR